MKHKIQLSTLLLCAILSVFGVFFLFPIIYGVLFSFTDWNGLSKNFEFTGLDNYVKMFKDTRFLDSITVTLQYAVILLIFTLVFGYVSARAISNTKRLKSGIFFISFFPYIITPVVACILWNQLFIGLFPQIGDWIGVDFLKSSLLSNKNTALYAVAFVDLWMLIPYSTLLFLSALNSVPKELIEYAQVEGANTRKIAIHIELPYVIPTLGMIITVVVSYAFTHIDTIMTLTSGGPGRVTETIYYTIYKNSSLEQQYAYGLAEGLVVAIASIIIFILISKITNGKNVDNLTTE